MNLLGKPAALLTLIAAIAVGAAAAVAQSSGGAGDGSDPATAGSGAEGRVNVPEAFGKPDSFPHREGEAVYRAVCQGCHMPDGEGAVGAAAYPSLAGNELLAEPGYPIYMVVHGQGGMPSFSDTLDDQQIANVVNFVRSHFGNDFEGAANPEDVSAVRP